MKKIIICGAGFAGLNAALLLEKKFKKQKNVSITLIDRHDYHLFNPELYEVATAEEELASICQLKKSIALPIGEVLSGRRIDFIKGEISAIDRLHKKIKVGIRELEYDFLILALGSKTEYFGIPGAEQYSLPLKQLKDAFLIRNNLEFSVEAHRTDAIKQYVRFMVAGGGYTGVELAAEMSKLADILAWKNNYPRKKIEILLIESENQLVPGFSPEAGQDVYNRLKNLGVEIKLLSPIGEVEKNLVTLLSGERVAFDVLVWTAGVRSQNCAVSGQCDYGLRGQFVVDEFLKINGNSNIFVLGDSACVNLKNKNIIPQTAQAAVAQAKYLSKALPQIIQNIKPEQFKLDKHPFILSVGGKWAMFKTDKFYFTGYWAYVLRQCANVRYFAALIGWLKAIKYVLFEAELYSRND